MTREEIYNSIWTIAQEEVTSQGYRFAADAEAYDMYLSPVRCGV